MCIDTSTTAGVSTGASNIVSRMRLSGGAAAAAAADAVTRQTVQVGVVTSDVLRTQQPTRIVGAKTTQR